MITRIGPNVLLAPEESSDFMFRLFQIISNDCTYQTSKKKIRKNRIWIWIIVIRTTAPVPHG